MCWTGDTGNIVHWWWEWKLIQLLWRTVWHFLQKLNIKLPHDSAVSLRGMYPKELQRDLNRHLYTVFSAALSTTATGTGSPASTDGGTDEQSAVCAYDGLLFILKREENYDTCYNVDEPWRKFCKIPLTWLPKVVQFIETESRMVSCQGFGGGENEEGKFTCLTAIKNMCVYIYIYKCVYIYVYICVHTHTQKSNSIKWEIYNSYYKDSF